MDKHQWHRVFSEKSQSQPASRWGHSCVSIADEIVFFGGYADSNYMNDVWAFNTVSMSWNEVKTYGQIPSNRSNCSMNYDKLNNRIIVFGGGGPNKKRFNSINILDWTTKEWTEINPKENEPGPWERTYHSAQLLYPYLIVFGGEGVSDLDDLWAYSFETNRWIQVCIDKSKPRPCARRFHSSAVVGNEFFVIAGCHGKYRCLSDIYSIDLSSMIETGSLLQLEWKELKIKSYSFLTRWGHTSVVYDRKIYIFGGRFSNDLNDILVVDTQKQTMKSLKITGELPKPRRRHSSVFVGSCMIIFGGFNGQYFNDLNYVNVFELKSKLEIPQSTREFNLLRYVNNPVLADISIKTQEGSAVYAHKGLLLRSFRNSDQLNTFIEEIDGRYCQDEVIDMMECLYSGIGNLSKEISQKYSLILFESAAERDNSLRRQVFPSIYENGSIGRGRANTNPIVMLDDAQYEDFLENQRSATYNDVTLIINQEYFLPANRVQLGVNSKYFRNLMQANSSSEIEIVLPDQTNIILFEIVLNYLRLDYVVIPQEADQEFWMLLYKLAEYYCLGRLMIVCQSSLISKVTERNCEDIMIFALANEIDVLALYCGEYQIKTILGKDQKSEEWNETKIENEELNKKKEEVLNIVYNMLRFDIDQIQIEKENLLHGGMKNQHLSEQTAAEKENNEVSYNE